MADKKNQAGRDQSIAKCGLIAAFFILLFGLILGLAGVLLSHLAISFYQYHLVFLYPVLMGMCIGVGASAGARLTRCSRPLTGFLLIVLLGVFCYPLLLILNNFALLTEPITVVQEYQYLVEDFVDPLRTALTQGEGNKIQEGLKVGSRFVSLLPSYDEKAMASNHAYATFLEYPGFTTWNEQKKVLEFDKVKNWTVWLLELLVLVLVAWEKISKTIRYNYGKAYSKRMLQSELGGTPVRTKTPEDLLNTLNLSLTQTSEPSEKAETPGPVPKRRGWLSGKGAEQVKDAEKKANNGRTPIRRGVGAGSDSLKAPAYGDAAGNSKDVETPEPGDTIVRPDTAKTQVREDVAAKSDDKGTGTRIDTTLRLEGPETETGEATPLVDGNITLRLEDVEAEIRRSAGMQPGGTEMGEQMDAKSREGKDVEERGDRKEKPQEQGHTPPTLSFAYALLLREYDPARKEELIRLIAKLGLASLEKTKFLLKTPSLLKAYVTDVEAQALISVFNEVGAKVQVITIEQLQAIQNKQQMQRDAESAPSPVASTPQSSEGDQRYAILLQKFDEKYKEQVLQLLASLTGLTVARLRQTLRTPALTVKNVTEDEADRISQQFKNLNAEVSILTMQELQKMFARK